MKKLVYGLQICFICLSFLVFVFFINLQGYSMVDSLKASSIVSCSLAIAMLTFNFANKISPTIFVLTLIGLATSSLFVYFFDYIFKPLFPTLYEKSLFIVGFRMFVICVITSLIVQHSQNFYLNIPFVKFEKNDKARAPKYIFTISALSDYRILEFAIHGIFGNEIVLPKCALNQANRDIQNDDENIKSYGNKILETIKKLEAISEKNLTWDDSEDFSNTEGLVKIAMRHEGGILIISDSKLAEKLRQQNVKVFDINALANCLKPIKYPGEEMSIKIQRTGKEPGQGVGYMEDGSMVVVNDGEYFMGKVIKTRVLSVTQTMMGARRIIFCNVHESENANLINSSKTEESKEKEEDACFSL